MKRQRRVIIFILSFSATLFLFLFLNYHAISHENMLLANGLYSHWAIELLEDPWQQDFFIDSNARIFLEHTTSGNIRTIKDFGDWTPPLLEGVFFNDSFNEGSFAVVGKEVAKEHPESFFFENHEFEVIGIMGADFPTILDYLVLFNDGNQNLTIEKVVLDGDSRNEIQRLSTGLVHRSLFTDFEQHEFSSRFRLGRDLFEEMMMVNATAILLLITAISSHAFFTLSKRNDKILSLQGFTSLHIGIKNHFALGMTFVLSFFIVIFADMIWGFGMNPQIMSDLAVCFFCSRPCMQW